MHAEHILDLRLLLVQREGPVDERWQLALGHLEAIDLVKERGRLWLAILGLHRDIGICGFHIYFKVYYYKLS